MKIVVLGLSLSSSWGNGHATTYRALLKALARRGHDILFLERDVPWYAQNRDLLLPNFCRLEFYSDLSDLHRFDRDVASADLTIVGSFVPDGIQVSDWVLQSAEGTNGVTAFYDIDTPITISAVRQSTCAYLARRQIPQFDLYLSFTGGPLLKQIEIEFGVRCARSLYCSVDTELFRPLTSVRVWDLGYLGTYSADRQPVLEELLIKPAVSAPNLKFVVAGAQYPQTIKWPANIERIDHIAPQDIPVFFSKMRWALNATRTEMVETGYSPSVRLFEAAACGCPLISDNWVGIETLFSDGKEIILAAGATDVVSAMALPEIDRRRIATAARSRISSSHSSDQRAVQLENIVIATRTSESRDAIRSPARESGNRSEAILLSRRQL